MTTSPNLTTDALFTDQRALSRAPSRGSLVLASSVIVLPSLIAAMAHPPLPVRGVSAIISGFALLLFGPYLFSHALVYWAQRAATK